MGSFSECCVVVVVTKTDGRLVARIAARLKPMEASPASHSGDGHMER
jgi:hypothetical protein